MKRLKCILSLLLFACWLPAMAQSDIEMTDSTSTEWGDDIGGGIFPNLPTDPVTSLALSKTDITLDGGDRIRLTAQTNSTAANKAVTWSVADKKIAIVSSNGTVTGLKIGTTTVTATSVSNPEISASCKVTVMSDYTAPSSGWILPWGKEEAWGMKYKFFEQEDYVEPANDAKGNTWKDLNYNDTSWDTLTGPMGSEGIWYAPFNYVWHGEYNCFCLRRVFDLLTVGTGNYVFRMQHDDDIQVYMNGQLVIDEPNWTDEQVSEYKIPNDAFVSGENILAIYIKQNWGGAYLDYGLYYESIDPVTTLSLSSSELTLKMGEYAVLKAVANENAYNKDVTWSVANSEVATVSATGRVKGVKTGTTTVTAASVSNPEVTATCIVNVTAEYVEKGDLPDAPFEFFFDAANYDEASYCIPNHEAATLNDYNLQLSANLPTFNGDYLTLNERCEGYLDRWDKGSTESGSYFYRGGQDNMTIVCKVKPKRDLNNAMDFISNRGGGYNYMLRVGQNNSIFLHTETAYEEGRCLQLPNTDEPQILAVRVNGAEDYIKIENLTTGETRTVSGVNWGGGDNIMKFFYNDDGEYWIGDFYWMYYSFEYLNDDELLEFLYLSSQDSIKPGDVNNDGMNAIDDVVLTINYVLGDISENFVFSAGDLNNDGAILIDDVVLVIKGGSINSFFHQRVVRTSLRLPLM